MKGVEDEGGGGSEKEEVLAGYKLEDEIVIIRAKEVLVCCWSNKRWAVGVGCLKRVITAMREAETLERL